MMQSYSDTERLIYGPYHNGVAEVMGDPLRIYRHLVHGLDGEPNQYLHDAKHGEEPDRFEATEKILAATVAAFQLLPFDPSTGAGVLEDQILDLFKDFVAWIEKKNPTPPTTPTSPPPTDCSPAQSPTPSASACS